ncbi:MAG: proton-translocating transhydrogenase family protein [Holosporales bacterium]|nr:proton-translocating transhydrogenase family protein [Holosporales bacterium]
MTFIYYLTVFILASFVGYYVVSKVTPALHSPLMSVTNAISSVIIIGGILASGFASNSSTWGLVANDGILASGSVLTSSIWGFIAVVLTAINIVGGFVITQRMLAMFSTNKKNKE